MEYVRDPSLWEDLLSAHGYDLLGLLDSGSFSEVFSVRSRATGSALAVKRMVARTNIMADTRVAAEVVCLAQLSMRGACVVRLEETILAERLACLVLELAPLGDLERHAEQHWPLGERLVTNCTRQVLSALTHCHRLRIAHRDLNPANVLLVSPVSVRLADFGLAVKCRDPVGRPLLCDDYLGRDSYLAPEVLRQEPYHALTADLWSMGGLCAFLLTGKHPQPAAKSGLGSSLGSMSAAPSSEMHAHGRGVEHLPEAWGRTPTGGGRDDVFASCGSSTGSSVTQCEETLPGSLLGCAAEDDRVKDCGATVQNYNGVNCPCCAGSVSGFKDTPATSLHNKNCLHNTSSKSGHFALMNSSPRSGDCENNNACGCVEENVIATCSSSVHTSTGHSHTQNHSDSRTQNNYSGTCPTAPETDKCEPRRRPCRSRKLTLPVPKQRLQRLRATSCESEGSCRSESDMEDLSPMHNCVTSTTPSNSHCSSNSPDVSNGINLSSNCFDFLPNSTSSESSFTNPNFINSISNSTNFTSNGTSPSPDSTSGCVPPTTPPLHSHACHSRGGICHPDGPISWATSAEAAEEADDAEVFKEMTVVECRLAHLMSKLCVWTPSERLSSEDALDFWKQASKKY